MKQANNKSLPAKKLEGGRFMFKAKKKLYERESTYDLVMKAEKAAERSDRLSNFALGFSIFVLVLQIITILVDCLVPM